MSSVSASTAGRAALRRRTARRCAAAARAVALGRRREDRAALAAKCAPDLGLANSSASVGIAAGGEHVSRSSAQRQHRPSTTSSPGLQYQPEICITGVSNGRAKPRQRAAAIAGHWPWRSVRQGAASSNGEIDQRHGAEFAVELAGGFDVVGDGEGDDARRDLASALDEALAGDARPVDLDRHIGAAARPGRPKSARPCGRRRRGRRRMA